MVALICIKWTLAALNGGKNGSTKSASGPKADTFFCAAIRACSTVVALVDLD
jgi:hypothetical protein